MYLKLQFHEEIIKVPASWGGVLVSLKANPEIIAALPRGVSANKRVASNQAGTKHESHFKIMPHFLQKKFGVQHLIFPGNYDYYLKCKSKDANEIKNNLEIFLKRFKNKQPAVLVGEYYPKINPIVQQFEREFCYQRHHSKFFGNKKEMEDVVVADRESLITKLVC